MGQGYVIYNHLKQDTGRAPASPDFSALQWNEFYQDVSCSIFRSDGRLLLVREQEDAPWNICHTFCIGSETGRDAVLRLLDSLFTPPLPTEHLQYLRALKRRYTITDLYELSLSDDVPLVLRPDVLSCFVTEAEFDVLCAESLVVKSVATAFHYREMLAMHYKNIYRSGWPRVTGCSYIWEYVRDDCLDGVVSLHAINDVKGGPSVKYMEGQEFTITDAGYYWLQYAPKGQNFWLTVMYDTEYRIVQYYFDITYLNEVYWDGTAYFFDLFLDIVLLPNGHQLLLDEDELLEAYQSGQITKDMLELAYAEYHRLTELLRGHEPTLHALCDKLLHHLRRRMETNR